MAGTLAFFIILYTSDFFYIIGELSSTASVKIAESSSLSTFEAAKIMVSEPPEDHHETQIPAEDPEQNTSPPMQKESPHEGFVYLASALSDARFDVRYATTHNFTGQIVDGYHSDKISITLEAAKALQKASAALKEQGYGLLIYDAYRPKRAVSFFLEWAEQPENNLTKAEFYPDYKKKDLFKLSYLAKRSAHSRGSTIDLTLFDQDTGTLLDMGSPYDFLGPISNHGTALISEVQTENRNILKNAMKTAGFKELRTEWWHFQLINEPYPDTAFDFLVE